MESTGGATISSARNARAVAHADRADVDAAIAAGVSALAVGLAAHERAAILERAAALTASRLDDLAWLVREEVDKPITLARAEIERAVATLRFSAVEALRLAGRAVPMDAAASGVGKLAYTQRVPRGVIGAITPFNFPINLVAHKLAPALAAACPVVMKPAPQAPRSAVAFAEIFADAGLPSGWLSVLPGAAEEVGGAIVDHPDVPVISFTGSTRVGWELARRAPRKKVLLELGGSAPAIVAADADLALAAEKVGKNAFSYAGQSCVSVQRVYVVRDVADEFAERLLSAVDQVRVGDCSDPAVVCGPLIDAAAVERLTGWIEEARSAGAEMIAGGEVDGRQLAPTVLVGVPHNSPLIQEEAFGPVLCVQAVGSLGEAIDRANGTRFGLQAGIFTSSLANSLEATHRLRFGAVLVNEVPTFRADHMPYGGGGDSGNTREGPAMAVREFTEERLVIFDLPQGGSNLD